MFWNLINNLFTQKKDRQPTKVLSKLRVLTETSPTIRDFSRAKRQILGIDTQSDNN